jgi:hypothetical protein
MERVTQCVCGGGGILRDKKGIRRCADCRQFASDLEAQHYEMQTDLGALTKAVRLLSLSPEPPENEHVVALITEYAEKYPFCRVLDENTCRALNKKNQDSTMKGILDEKIPV